MKGVNKTASKKKVLVSSDGYVLLPLPMVDYKQLKKYLTWVKITELKKKSLGDFAFIVLS